MVILAKEIGDLQVKLGLDGTGFQHGISHINRQMRLVQSSFEAASLKLGKFEQSTDHLKLKVNLLTQQLQLQTKKVDALKQAFEQSAEAKGTDAKATQDLAIKLNKAQGQLSKMSYQLDEVNQKLQHSQTNWQKLSQKMNQVSEKLKNVGHHLSEAGQSLTLLSVPLLAVGGGAIKIAIQFENAFAGVRKTVEGTEKDFQILSAGVRQMAKEIPVAANEIAKVAEVAGQLGIKKENILSFTRTIVDLGVSTNMTSEQAANALARLANICQMPQEKFRNLGSTLIALGNTLASTESEMAEMALRIAGAGHQVNMTEAQIVSFGAALSSVGIAAEAGGSSISRTMIEIANSVQQGGKKLNLFAKVAGMSAAEFKKSFKEDAGMAIISFIEGLGKIKQSGQNVFQVLKDLSLNEILVRDALLRASGAGNLFRKSLETGTKAWKQNIALTNEAEERYQTTASQMKVFWNRLKDLGITIGQSLTPALIQILDAAKPLVTALDYLAKKFTQLSPATKIFLVTVGGIALIVGPFLIAMGAMVSSLGTLIFALRIGIGFFMKGGKEISGFMRLMRGIGGVFSTVGRAIVSIGPIIMRLATGIVPMLVKSFRAVITVFNLLRVALLTNPFGLIITAVGLLIGAGIALYQNWDTVKNFLVQTLTTIKQAFIIGMNTVVSYVSDKWSSLKNVTLATQEQIASGTQSTWNSITSYLKERYALFAQLSVNLFTAMKSGISNAMTAIRSVIQNGMNSAIDWLASLPSRMLQLGKNAISGFINGISSLIGRVRSVIANVAATVKNGIQSALGIRSPSRVLMELGGNVGEGFAIGIENTLAKIQRQAQLMSQAAIPSILPSRERISGSNSTTPLPSPINITFNFTKPVVMQNQSDIRELAFEVEKVLRRMNIAQARASGVISFG